MQKLDNMYRTNPSLPIGYQTGTYNVEYVFPLSTEPQYEVITVLYLSSSLIHLWKTQRWNDKAKTSEEANRKQVQNLKRDKHPNVNSRQISFSLRGKRSRSNEVLHIVPARKLEQVLRPPIHVIPKWLPF